MGVSETTVYLAAIALVVIGGTLLWAKVGDLLVRIIGVGTLVFFGGLMVAEAPLIAESLGGGASRPDAQTAGARFDDAVDSFLAEDESDAAALVRELLELEPGLRDEARALVQEAAEQPDPQAFLVARFYSLTEEFSQRLLPILVAADDESFQRLTAPIARVSDRLPTDDSGCLAVVRDGGASWVAEVGNTLPGVGEELISALLALVRDAKGRPPVLGLDGGDIRFLEEQMMRWMAGLGQSDVARIMAMGGGGGGIENLGALCGLVRNLFRYIADQPAPQGGRLLRVLLSVGLQGA